MKVCTFGEDIFIWHDQWFVKGHLGNVRSVINISNDSDAPVSDVILEQNDYLPYGTKVPDVSTPALSDNRYRYAGKEEQRFGTFDSQLLDFGARYYDPWSCQWTAVDPLGEKYYSMTPYGYCGASPLMFMDPKGMDIYTMDAKGNIKLYQNTDDEYDEAYAEWGDGPLDQNAAHVIIHDKFILPSMAQGNDPSGDCSRPDMKSLFKFAADTFDSQEWGLYYNKDAYELTTEADGARVSTSLNGVTWKVHSHPNEPANDKAEIESMGYWTYDDSAYDSKGNLLNNNASWYESAFVGNDASNHINSHGVISYVYFPVSGNSYRLTKNQLPYKTTIK